MIHFGRKGLGVIINHESSIISEKLKVEGNVWFQEIFENVLVWPLDSLETSTLNIEIKDLEFHSRSKIISQRLVKPFRVELSIEIFDSRKVALGIIGTVRKLATI